MKNPKIDISGNRYWKNDQGLLHRVNAPAYEQFDGPTAWYINGKRHRIDGPAADNSIGYLEWWVDDIRLDTQQVKNWYQTQGLDIDIPLTKDEQILFKLKFG